MRSLIVVMLIAGAVRAQPAETTPAPALPSVADTQPVNTVAIRGSISMDAFLAGGIELDVGRRLRDRIYLHASAIYGVSSLPDPAGSGQSDGSLFGASTGLAYIHCGPLWCRGVGMNLGYQYNRVSGNDGLIEPPDWVDERHGIVLEARALARARLGGLVAIEVAGTLRENTKVTGAGDRFAIGFGFAIGLVATN